MFISSAYAQSFGGGGAGGLLDAAPQFLMMLAIGAVFYFLLIRPQQKKVKEHRSMVEALRRGDKVVTNGGIIGVVSKVSNEREVILEISDGVRVRAMRAMIAEVMARTEPAAGGAKEIAKSDEEGAYYKVLGLTASADAAAIEAAFAAKLDEPGVAEAYETLKDPIKRRLYDRLGHDEYVRAAKA